MRLPTIQSFYTFKTIKPMHDKRKLLSIIIYSFVVVKYTKMFSSFVLFYIDLITPFPG